MLWHKCNTKPYAAPVCMVAERLVFGVLASCSLLLVCALGEAGAVHNKFESTLASSQNMSTSTGGAGSTNDPAVLAAIEEQASRGLDTKLFSKDIYSTTISYAFLGF